MTPHQVNNVQTNSFGHNDTTFQPQLLPNFSTARLSSTIKPVETSASISAMFPQISSFPCLPDQDIKSDSVVTCAQCLPPASAESFTNVAYRSNARNEISLHHSFPVCNKQSQPLNNHYQMNGNYSGEMSNLQQEFARMVIA